MSFLKHLGLVALAFILCAAIAGGIVLLGISLNKSFGLTVALVITTIIIIMGIAVGTYLASEDEPCHT